MLRRTGRAVQDDVRFCDECAEVSTSAQRAERRRDRIRSQVLAWTALR